MTIHQSPLQLLIEALACVAAADLVTGAVHWLEDTYGSETWPLVGPAIIAPNRLHHEQPRAFIARSWWSSSQQSVIAGGIVAAGLFVAGWLSWQAVLFLVVAVNANEIHKWAHRTRAENGRLITALQRAGLVQSRAHHGGHHGGARDTRYCVVTPWLNPVLDRAGFWRGVERAIAAVSGVAPRLDEAARRARASDRRDPGPTASAFAGVGATAR